MLKVFGFLGFYFVGWGGLLFVYSNNKSVYQYICQNSWKLCFSYNALKFMTPNVITLALGLQPRQGLARLRAKKEVRESHQMLLGMQKSVREWTLTFPNEFSIWELESQWTFKSSKGDCRGQNPFDWKIIYIIGKVLKRRCIKWARMTHLDIWNINYGQKKAQKSN